MNTLPITKIDSHAHVFTLDLPMQQNRRYTPQMEAPLTEYLHHLDQFGFSHGVLIQPSFLGTDNSYLIKAIKQAAPRLKGVVCVEPTISFEELEQLNVAQIVGIRLNLINKPLPDLTTPIWQKLLSHVRALNWHIELHCHSDKLNSLLFPLVKQNIRTVIDHFGRPLNYQVSQDIGFQQLLKWGSTGLVWCKLSGLYRIIQTELQSQHFINEVMPSLLTYLGANRLMWGSDWPHTQHEADTNYSKVILQMQQMLGEPQIAQTILRDTPAEFFKFI